MLKFKNISTLAAAALLLAACGPTIEETLPAAQSATAAAQSAPAVSEVFDFGAGVTEARLVAAENEPGQWMSNGRDYGEQRFSPLDQINTENVSQLSLAWSGDIDTSRGQEATPIVVDGAV